MPPAPRLRRLRPLLRRAALAAVGLGWAVLAPTFSPSARGDDAPRVGPQTGLPVPRFASLKFDRVNGREGPSFEHPILWRYQRRGLPVLVIEEDVAWRKVRDPDGVEVWMHQRVLDRRRTGLVAGGPARVLRRPEADAPVAAIAEPGVLFEIKACRDGWMRVDGARAAGWLPEGSLWGAGCG